MSATSTLKCVRCQAAIPIPAELTRTLGGSLVCPSCGQRYTRRTPGAGATAPGAAPPAPPLPGAATGAAVARTPPSGSTRRLPSVTGSLGGLGGASAPPIFETGAVLAGRYRIVRFLARGGMGEVYEAEDGDLRERVALKTVHPSVASEEGAIDRFKREIHLARKVTHPNVCRIFDVGYHAEADRTPIVFLTMELLEGETLSARLRRRGRLPVEEALPIARQSAAALAAAHAAGVVHRDFKCENVFLVPRGESERVVVTDFGIARGGSDDAFGLTLTSAGGVVGTPAYMAPEQVAGETVTPAVDQYALGIVLFEMVTGDLPFKGETPISTAAKRLTEAAPSPSTRVPELDSAWSAAIERALARQPERRFASVLDLVDALEGRPTHPTAEARSAPFPPPSPTVTPPVGPSATAPVTPSSDAVQRPSAASAAPARSERRKRWLAALLLLLLAAASVWAWVRIQRLREEGQIVRPQAARRTVAVIGFRNLSGREESAWLSTALSEMLATELGQGGELRVIPGEAVAQALLELGRPQGESLAADERERLRARLGTDYLVLGGYTALPGGGPLRLDLRLVDTRQAEPLRTLAETGAESELFALVGRAGNALREGMGVRASGPGRSLLPTSTEAARLYAEGLDALRGFDPQRARDLLARAAELDPENALVRSTLSLAWGALGYGERAAAEAERAFEHAETLPDPERSIVEARYYESTGEWARAAEIWQALWQTAPDSLEHGLAVARTRTRAGALDGALSVLAVLRSLPPPEGEDPRIDQAEAAVAAARGDFARQAEAAERAAVRAEAIGARRIAAESLVARAWALRNQGTRRRARRGAARGRSPRRWATAPARPRRCRSRPASRARPGSSTAPAPGTRRRSRPPARPATSPAPRSPSTTSRWSNVAAASSSRRSSTTPRRRRSRSRPPTGGAPYAGSNVAATLAERGPRRRRRSPDRFARHLARARRPGGDRLGAREPRGVRRRQGISPARATRSRSRSPCGARSANAPARRGRSPRSRRPTSTPGSSTPPSRASTRRSLSPASSATGRGGRGARGLGELLAARGDAASAGARSPRRSPCAARPARGRGGTAEDRARPARRRALARELATAAKRPSPPSAKPPPEAEAAARGPARAALGLGRTAAARRSSRCSSGAKRSASSRRSSSDCCGAGRGRTQSLGGAHRARSGRRRGGGAGLLPLELEARLAAADLDGASAAGARAAIATRARAAGLLPLAASAERAPGRSPNP
ncbi:MAG: protein kinase [Holophagales bacterium]|nr:protein kinase [Holophagales bacterium]